MGIMQIRVELRDISKVGGAGDGQEMRVVMLRGCLAGGQELGMCEQKEGWEGRQ